MEFGFQDKRKRNVLIGCLAVLVLAIAYSIYNWPSDEAAGRAPVAQARAESATASPQNASDYVQRRRMNSIDIYHIDPTIHLGKLTQAATADYTTMKRNLFLYEFPPPPPPPKKTPQQILEEKKQLENAPPPPPPPIDLKYYGFATDAASKTKKVFLTNGQDIFIAREGDVVGNRYKVLSIGVNSVEVEDLKNKNRQRLPLIES